MPLDRYRDLDRRCRIAERAVGDRQHRDNDGAIRFVLDGDHSLSARETRYRIGEARLTMASAIRTSRAGSNTKSLEFPNFLTNEVDEQPVQ